LRSSFAIDIAKRTFHFTANCNHGRASQRKPSHLHTIVALAYLVLNTTVMWDLIFIMATAAFFAVSLAYVQGCQRL